MVLKGINFRSIVFAGLVAGYVMSFMDHYLAGAFGLFGVLPGIADIPSMLAHLTDSVLFAVLFATPAIYLRLPGTGWVKGAIYGALLWLCTALLSAVFGAAGSTILSQIPMTPSIVFSSVILHLVYGVFLGALYVTPPESKKPVEETYYMFSPRKRAEMIHHQ